MHEFHKIQASKILQIGSKDEKEPFTKLKQTKLNKTGPPLNHLEVLKSLTTSHPPYYRGEEGGR